MTFIEHCVLGVLIQEDRLLRHHELCALMEWNSLGSQSVLLARLVSLGAISKPYHGGYQITERGRIAHALHTFWEQRAARRRAAA